MKLVKAAKLGVAEPRLVGGHRSHAGDPRRRAGRLGGGRRVVDAAARSGRRTLPELTELLEKLLTMQSDLFQPMKAPEK